MNEIGSNKIGIYQFPELGVDGEDLKDVSMTVSVTDAVHLEAFWTMYASATIYSHLFSNIRIEYHLLLSVAIQLSR